MSAERHDQLREMRDYLDSHKPIRAPADDPQWIICRMLSRALHYFEADPGNFDATIDWMHDQLPAKVWPR